jgi:MFS family permease
MDSKKKIFHGWYIVAACAGIHFLLQGGIPQITYTFYSVTSADRAWGGSNSQMWWMIALFAILGIVAVLITGRVVDRVGSKKPMLVGCILCAAALFVLAGISDAWKFHAIQFFLYQIGIMVAAGIAIDVLLLRWFRRRRGIVFGLVGAASGVGALAMKPAALPLVEELGWSGSCILFGMFALCITVPLVHYYIKNKPSDMGLAPDGDEPGELEHDNTIGHTLREAYRTRSFWLIVVGLFLLNFARAPISMNLLFYGAQLGYSQAHIRIGLEYSGGLGIIGTLLLGWLADRWGARKVFIVGAFMTAACIVLLIAASHIWILILYFLVYGIFASSVLMLAPMIIADCHGLREIGIILALLGLIGGIGGTVSPPLFGLIIDTTSDSAQASRYAFALLIPIALLSAYCIYKTQPLSHAGIEEEPV